MRWLHVVAAATTLMCAFTAARLALSRPIGFDEAYNLQIAKSISTKFCYCTEYRPERVFPVEASTNGVALYVGASFFALTGSPDDAKAGTVAVAVLVLGAVLLLLDPWLVFLALLLYFVWPWFHVTVISFGGEIFAIAFTLLGLYLLRRAKMFVAAVCFGVALESKLISILVILPVAWALLYGQIDGLTAIKRAYRATFGSLIVTLGAGIVLFLLTAFSVVHSTRNIDIATISTAYTGHIYNMIGQGQRAANGTDLAQVVQTSLQVDSPVIVVLFIMSAVLLIRTNPANGLFVAATCIWWLYYGKTERHLVISFFATIILAGLEGEALLKRMASKIGISVLPLSLASLAMVAVIAIGIGLVTRGSLNVALKRFPDPEHVVATAAGRMVYSARLIHVLREHRYILTSGWWQMPEITLRENLEFYDRMSPSNADLSRREAVLFFDKDNTWFPITTISGNCERVLYTEGPLVVCTPKQSEPLAYQLIETGAGFGLHRR